MSHSPETIVTSLSDDFQLPNVVFPDGSVSMRDAGGLPIIRFPDGTICYLANMYVLEEYVRGKSVTNRGGTIRAYASLLSHLIKFAHNNNLSFAMFTDSLFQQFIASLNVQVGIEDDKGDEHKRKIIFKSLDFLFYIGELVGLQNYVGKNGIIRAVRAGRSPSTEHPDLFISNGWECENLPLSKSGGHGVAMGDEALAALKQATTQFSPFLAQRNDLMIDLMNATGPRRGETVPIKVVDILDALTDEEAPNSLRLRTLKHGQLEFREVAATSTILEKAKDHIDMSRRRIIKQKLGKQKRHTSNAPPSRSSSQLDHGYLFVSERTGKPLSTNYITNIFINLRKIAKLEEKAHAHQLRHRFIQTRKVTHDLLIDLGAKSTGLTSEHKAHVILLKLAQESGHKRITSLRHYLQQVDDEISKTSLSERNILREEALRCLPEVLEKLYTNFQTMTVSEFHSYLKTLILATKRDLGDYIAD
ncbi:tyrosine-type recombinase/integrase [Pseudomonas sp. NPDC088368]|uniref:tyrosine-type recombinase/integrase n=1 Tax=Pseudomonas sp. NPDC088368 TaxID=3364453 RepID=UPI0037F3253E